MGLLKRRSTDSPLSPPPPDRLARMSTDDVYLMVEAALMESQFLFSKVRSSAPEDKKAALAWVKSGLETALMGAHSLSERV